VIPRLAHGHWTRIRSSPGLPCALPSLGSVNKALQESLATEQSYAGQVSEIIRRDPSLTARLLRLVNSLYVLSSPLSSIEEAVFYLGIRQVRQITMIMPVIEEFHRLTAQCPFAWREFWQHSLGTAMLTREIFAAVQAPRDESDYIAGLLHDVGKIAMAWSFPDHFAEIHKHARCGERDLLEIESEVLGLDHAEIGGLYLERQRLPAVLVRAARFHHRPEVAGDDRMVVAAVQMADLFMRNLSIGCSGNYAPVTREKCLGVSGAQILFPTPGEAERAFARGSLSRSLERLPGMLAGMV
jgi:HD-like signal output (HDOD) protein